MSNLFVTFLKKVGAILVWPVTRAVMLSEILATAYRDEPEVKAVVIGVVQQFEGIDADVVAAVAAGGSNITADMKGFTDIVAFFKYMKDTALPTIEGVYTQLKTDGSDDAPADPPPPVTVLPAPQPVDAVNSASRPPLAPA